MKPKWIILGPVIGLLASCGKSKEAPPKAVVVPEEAVAPEPPVMPAAPVIPEAPVAVPVEEVPRAGAVVEEEATTVGERVDRAIDATRHGLGVAGEKTKEGVGTAVEKTGGALETAGEKTEEGVKKAAEATGGFLKKVGEKLENAAGGGDE